MSNVINSRVAAAICVFATLGGHAASASATPTDEQIDGMLTPSGENTEKDPWEFGEFERSTNIPGVTIQNLPAVQMAFRVRALKAVSRSISKGAKAALETYSEEVPHDWIRIVVPRKKVLFKKSESVVFLKVNDAEKKVEIAIRGTANFDDALRDLEARAVFDDILKIRLHSGFRTISLEIYEHLKKHHLNSNMLRDYEFSLYGHSLGGAVAAILSMYLHHNASRVAAVITFGAPRFTTSEGARKYQVLNTVTHRVVRCDDVIPFLPPKNFFGWSNESYQANGNIFLLLKPTYFDYSIGIDIERDFVNQLRLELVNRKKTKQLAHGHRMLSYYERLGNYEASTLSIEMGEPEAEGSRYFKAAELLPVHYNLKDQKELCPASE